MSQHLIEPGEHACEWHLEGQTLPGTVSFRAGRRITGQIFCTEEVWSSPAQARRAWQFRKFGTMRGQLRSGSAFVLSDCTVRYHWGPAMHVAGIHAVCGPAVRREGDTFEVAEMQFTGLTAFSGEEPLYYPTVDDDMTIFTVRWRPESDQLCMAGHDEVALLFRREASFSGPYKFTMSTRPLIRVKGKARTLAQWIDDYVLPFRAMISAAMFQPQRCSWFTVGVPANETFTDGLQREIIVHAQVYGVDFSQDPFDADGSSVSDRPLFSAGSRGAPLGGLVTSWRNFAERYATFVELAVSGLSNELPFRASFLTIVPGLESYHAERSGDRDTAIKEHRKKRNGVFADIKKDIAKDHYDWLKRWVDTRGTPSLDRRLRDLHDSLDPDLKEHIERYLSRPPRAVADFKPDASDIWLKISALRNDLAHGGASHPDSLVIPLLRAVRTIAAGCILKELDVSANALIADIQIGAWKVI